MQSSGPTDRAIAYYDDRASTMDSAYTAEPTGWVLDMIAEMKRTLRGRRVLEVACGTGYWTRYAAETAAHVTGVDAAPNMLAVARAKEATGHRRAAAGRRVRAVWRAGRVRRGAGDDGSPRATGSVRGVPRRLARPDGVAGSSSWATTSRGTAWPTSRTPNRRGGHLRAAPAAGPAAVRDNQELLHDGRATRDPRAVRRRAGDPRRHVLVVAELSGARRWPEPLAVARRTGESRGSDSGSWPVAGLKCRREAS